MGKMRKITVAIPRELIESVQAATGKGVASTVSEALTLLYQREVQNRTRELRGKVIFSMSMGELRDDHE